jgi:hypothetical protein
MVIARQRIDTDFDVDGERYRLVVARDLVLELLCRRRISDAEFFSFVEQNRVFLILMGRRKLFKQKGDTKGITLDKTDLPDYGAESSAGVRAAALAGSKLFA